MKIKIFFNEYETNDIDYISYSKSGVEYLVSVCIKGKNKIIPQSVCIDEQKTLDQFINIRKNLERFGNFAFNNTMLVNIENVLDVDIKQVKDKFIKKYYIEAVLSTGEVFKSSPTKHLEKCIRLESYFLASKKNIQTDTEFEAMEKAYKSIEK